MVLWPLRFTVIRHGMEQSVSMLHTLTAPLTASAYILHYHFVDIFFVCLF